MTNKVYNKLKYAQSLSNRLVIGLAICLFIAGVALIFGTASVLLNAGNPVLAIFAVLPMGKGLAHYWLAIIRFCRPDWFKSSPTYESK